MGDEDDRAEDGWMVVQRAFLLLHCHVSQSGGDEQKRVCVVRHIGKGTKINKRGDMFTERELMQTTRSYISFIPSLSLFLKLIALPAKFKLLANQFIQIC